MLNWKPHAIAVDRALRARQSDDWFYDVSMPEIARLLESVEEGDLKAGEELLPLVYQELRKLAAARMSRQPPGQTIQATALVHEAWLRVEKGGAQRWKSRNHFFAAAAQAMRHILIERARRRSGARHGGDMERVPLEEIEIAAPADDERLLRINSALEELAAVAPEKAEVVKLRFFVGLDAQETAELLGLSPRTVERYWSYAKAWLFERAQ
jgi:RNA polymerase sigma factor (TIGR02999 family)